jgi:hypothetical protein
MDHQEMKTYIGTKVLKAAPMTRKEYCTYRGWPVPDDENPDDAGYLVEYEDHQHRNHANHDGYISWSPTDVFEKAYRPMGCLTFGLVIEALKMGLRASRTGWNGKGMFIYLVPENSYPAQTGAAKAHFGNDAMVPYRAYIAMKTAQGDVVPWAPAQTDVLGEDWFLLAQE